MPASGFFSKFERMVSKPRLDSYKETGGTEHDALCRYLWNIALCESLYPSFQILEVGFRNAVHSEIAKHADDPEWLTKALFLWETEKDAVKKAKASLRERNRQVTEPLLVAEMNFGFWTSLLDARYEIMWHKIIAKVFPHMPKTMRTRGDASKLMNPVRKLRNAALHHHSIWHWRDLKEQHAQMHLLIGYLCDSMSKMAKQIDRFPEICRNGDKQFSAVAATISN